MEGEPEQEGPPEIAPDLPFCPWALEDLNLRPPPCKGGALAN